MPKVVPSVDNVLISYSYCIKQDQPTNIPLAVQRRCQAYRYSGLIAPSARKGELFDNIEEGQQSDVNTLFVFPAPVTTNTVSFKFSLAKPGNTKLTVTNYLGQEVAQIMNQFCNDSEYTFSDYDVSKLPNGTYYVTMKSGTVMMTKMFTIVR